MSRPTSPKRESSENYSGFEVPLANDAATAAQAEAQAEDEEVSTVLRTLHRPQSSASTSTPRRPLQRPGGAGTNRSSSARARLLSERSAITVRMAYGGISPSGIDDRGDWLAGAAIFASAEPSSQHKKKRSAAAVAQAKAVAAAANYLPPLSERELNWVGDGIMDRQHSSTTAMRPPRATPSPPPVPKPPPTRVEVKPSPRPRRAQSATAASPATPASGTTARPATASSRTENGVPLSPRANDMVMGRPCRVLRPAKRLPISQQDIFAMMDDKGVASNEAKEKATKAREAAAKRVAERHAAKVALEARSKAEARRQEEAKFNSERKRLRELFGLSELPVEAVKVAVKAVVSKEEPPTKKVEEKSAEENVNRTLAF